jgi:hypothetical protein
VSLAKSDLLMCTRAHDFQFALRRDGSRHTAYGVELRDEAGQRCVLVQAVQVDANVRLRVSFVSLL